MFGHNSDLIIEIHTNYENTLDMSSDQHICFFTSLQHDEIIENEVNEGGISEGCKSEGSQYQTCFTKKYLLPYFYLN